MLDKKKQKEGNTLLENRPVDSNDLLKDLEELLDDTETYDKW